MYKCVKYVVIYSDYSGTDYFKYDEDKSLLKAIDIMKDAKEQFPDIKFTITTNYFYKWKSKSV